MKIMEHRFATTEREVVHSPKWKKDAFGDAVVLMQSVVLFQMDMNPEKAY